MKQPIPISELLKRSPITSPRSPVLGWPFLLFYEYSIIICPFLRTARPLSRLLGACGGADGRRAGADRAAEADLGSGQEKAAARAGARQPRAGGPAHAAEQQQR